MFLSIALALAFPASAATITLDTGATIQGDLAVWQIDGDCQISVTDGPMVGSIVIVPCTKVARFERAPTEAPATALAPAAAPAAPPTAIAEASEAVEPLLAVEEPALVAVLEEPLAEPPLAMPATFPVEEAPGATIEPEPELYGEDLNREDPEPPVVKVRPPEPFSKATTRPSNRMLGTIQLPEIPRLKNALGRQGDDDEEPIVQAADDVDASAPATHHDPVDPGTLQM